jgi:hypothetical protein
MKNFLVLSIFVLLSSGPPVHGSETKPARSFELQISFGEKASLFKAFRLGDGASLEFHSNEGEKIKKTITLADLDFLNQTLDKIHAFKDQIEKCPTTRVMAILTGRGAKPTILEGCLFGNSPGASSLREMSDLLATLVQM